MPCRGAGNAPFNTAIVYDNCMFWVDESEWDEDDDIFEFRSYHFYYNRMLTPFFTLGAMIQPLAIADRYRQTSTLFVSSIDTLDSTSAFTQLARVRGDHIVKNSGIRADLSYSFTIAPEWQLYFRHPVEYRILKCENSSFILEHFKTVARTHVWEEIDSTYISSDSLAVKDTVVDFPAHSEYAITVKPAAGLARRSMKSYFWPYHFLPVVGQFINAELYYEMEYMYQWKEWHKSHGLDRWLGITFNSFQKICYANRIITGFENSTMIDAWMYHYKGYQYLYSSIDYAPHIEIFKHFFIRPLNVSFCYRNNFTYDFHDYEFQSNNRIFVGFKYAKPQWGVMVAAEPDKRNALDNCVFAVWKSW
ncbi:MAG: hypothetical protein GF350_06850 [Chitinivibrionales bacterium]|nr:hypothetical protein [Chitinivibrionales bacterium]